MSAASDAFVAQKTLAVVGVSRTRGFGNKLFRHLRQKGYRVFPVNSQTDSVEGERCFRRLDDLPEPVAGVVAVVPPAQTKNVVEDCARLGIKHIWMQQGAESEAAVALCRDKGIAVVAGECLLMHTDAGFPHSLHRWLWKKLGKY
ncbi:MAG: CoA-binding protein [Deltaproteobacteria bacterium]|nr:CoA-binding protein [Deltaproteobacteria bacterium]